MSSDNPLPTSYYPSIILGSDNNVYYAINPATSKKNWEFSLPSQATNPLGYFAPSPVVYNNMVYIASALSDTIYKINGQTGALVKKLQLPSGASVESTPLADANLLYVTCLNDSVYAIDTGTGAVKWRFGDVNNPTPFVASPVIFNNYVYVASTGGHVYCINKTTGPDPLTGFPVWDYPGWGTLSTASFISSPCVMDTDLFVGSITDSNLYCIKLNPTVVPTVTPTVGAANWIYKTNGAIKSSPTAYGGFCFVGSNDFNLYCIDAVLGQKQWAFRTNSQINSSPIISNQVVYIASYDYNLYAVNIVNGSQKWRFSTKGLLKSSPLPYNGSVYIGSYDGYLYAVDSAFGTMKWSYKINGNIESSPAIDDYSNKQYNSGISGYNTSGTNN